MKIFNTIDEWDVKGPVVVALGNFDGVHIGHQKLIGTCVNQAKEMGIKSLCYTFSNHPKNLIARINNKEKAVSPVRFITSNEEKYEYIASLGIDYILSIPFDKKTMITPANEFITNVLINKLNAKGVCCGFNYSFGARGEGTSRTLIGKGKELGFHTYVQNPVEVEGEVVSSSLIRKNIESGNMIKASNLLGHPYRVSGVVIEGNKLGRSFDMPTANISLEAERIVPPNGVYYTKTEIDGTIYNSISNIGVKPTIGNYAKSIETNVFGFDKSIYGKRIKVEFFHWKREEKKFEEIEDLIEQMRIDAHEAEIWWKEH